MLLLKEKHFLEKNQGKLSLNIKISIKFFNNFNVENF